MGAVEPEAESVSGHHGLGQGVGRSNLLEAEAVALQEPDGGVEQIRGDADRARRLAVRARGGASSSSTTSDIGMSPVRLSPSRRAFKGSGPFRAILAISPSVSSCR